MTSGDPGSEPYSTAIDGRILLFTLGISVLASLLFSVAPVFHFLRPDLANSLRQNTGTLSKESQRFRKIAVGVQIALSVMLLGGAGLFVRTLNHLRQEQVGFEVDHLVTFTLDPAVQGMAKTARRRSSRSALETLGGNSRREAARREPPIRSSPAIRILRTTRCRDTSPAKTKT